MKSWARRGLDLLLEAYPEHDVALFDPQDKWWWCVDLRYDEGPTRKFAIWKATGAVYRVDHDGTVVDDPFLVPEGSSYRGPVEARRGNPRRRRQEV